MMNSLYNLGIFIYNLLIHLAKPFNKKAKIFIDGRKGWNKVLAAKINRDDRYIWFHCASLGEFEQGRPIIEEVKMEFPEYKILLTFFSPSGFEIRKNYSGVDIISYLPIDSRKNVKLFYEITRPIKVYFIKYEFWFNYINEAKKRGIPLYIVSAIFRREQIFFKHNFLGNWFLKSLKGVNHFFVQNIESEKLLEEFGFDNISISGDTRFDRVAAIAKTVKKIPGIKKFKGNYPLVIVGSSWLPDEELVIKYINQSAGVKFIIAPHEVSDSNLLRIKKELKKPSEFYSNIQESEINNIDVLVIDSVGLLSSIYQYADIAYIGGGFGVGIHNILEAATFGMPVIFGPNYKKFKEANDLIELNVAFPILNFTEMEWILNNLLKKSEKLRELSDLIKNYINHNQGATQIIIKKTFDL